MIPFLFLWIISYFWNYFALWECFKILGKKRGTFPLRIYSRYKPVLSQACSRLENIDIYTGLQRAIVKALLHWEKLVLGLSTDLSLSFYRMKNQEVWRTDIIVMPRKAEESVRIHRRKDSLAKKNPLHPQGRGLNWVLAKIINWN